MARIALVQATHTQLFGLMYLSAVARRAGHEVRVFVYSGDDVAQRIREYRPRVVGLTALSGEKAWALNTARAIKGALGAEAFVIGGGMLPTFEPEVVEQDGFDAICRGEGEHPLLELVAGLEAGEEVTGVPNLWVKSGGEIHRNDPRPLMDDLDALPFPDRELYREYWTIYNAPMWRIWIARGCPHSCSYCFHHAYRRIFPKARSVRVRSVEDIFAELHEIKRDHSPEVLWMGADTFFLDRSWSLEILERYGREIGIPFVMAIRIEHLTDDMAAAIAGTGCCQWVSFGLESGDEHVRREILRRRMSDDQVRRGVELLRRHGVKVSTTNMMGFPDETFEQAARTLEFNAEVQPDMTVCSVFQPLPGTDLGAAAGECPTAWATEGEMELFSYGSSGVRTADIQRIERLHKFFFVGTYYPRTIPVIKAVTALPYPPSWGMPLFFASYFVFLKRPQLGSARNAAMEVYCGVRDGVNNLRNRWRRRRARD